jgi:hypothetical protein
MADPKQLFLHVEGKREGAVLSFVDETDQAIAEAIIAAAGLDANTAELFIFIEEDEEPIDRLSSHGRFRHRHHAHVHRCRRISVTVRYGEPKTKSFSPSASVARVRDWAVGKHGFDIDPIDAAKLALAQGDELLDPESRVGEYAKHPECSVTFDLVNKDRFQG